VCAWSQTLCKSDMQVCKCVFVCLFVHLYECLISLNIWRPPAVAVRSVAGTVQVSTGVRVCLYVFMHETTWVTTHGQVCVCK